MQTFLPYPDFIKSASVLDYRRLGKQRIECRTILSGKWPHHPASKMWRGYEYQLAEYGKAICTEWINRGYKDEQFQEIEKIQKNFIDTGLPKWFGNPDFHLAHQSNIIRKDFLFYSHKFPGVKNDLPYIWHF